MASAIIQWLSVFREAEEFFLRLHLPISRRWADAFRRVLQSLRFRLQRYARVNTTPRNLLKLFLCQFWLLFLVLFHNYNTIIMLTRCVRWSRPVLLWNIVCSSVNVVHQLLVELHFLFFFLFHNDMSFKLFIISVAKLRNKIENAETKREKCWSKREKVYWG